MSKGLRKTWHPVAWLTLACVLVLGYGLSGRADAAGGPSNQDILDQIALLQRAVTALQHTVDGLVNSGVATKLRRYYMTHERFTGAAALTACAQGFHMASLWEIFNMSTLEYDQALGVSQADAGAGPPSARQGWIRTGFNTISGNSAYPWAGSSNCVGWTVEDANHYGSVVGLTTFWNQLGDPTPTEPVVPWLPSPANCNFHASVWCIED